ncbi:unnamed protein product (macronuclear) [Paramecium tetraurelia]|uniref:Adenylate kinase isoenzyme 6 homolog n=1 Tax=Paramecium tetraurelia TaxID=5888 RepID=A0CXH2_PARTE|nr:uncharacterized protein GSPATT00011121001 [Paramecium tetraurelia]CAK75489.1 unnamed protein product [Paramecium tetraurelia]|eukprot:XP_001442886.1 hypothetical protein (macronuclear) [Paramecium tetraurelia strain d4-2]
MEIENNRQKPNILITGTPGVGKSTLGKLLSEHVEGLQYVDVGLLINQRKLYKEWNQEFNVPEFDQDMVCDELENAMQTGGMIIDFHTSSFFPERWFDLVVLLRTNNTVLYDRLKARGYEDKKITENIECEILDVSKDEVESSYKQNIIMELNNEEVGQLEQNILQIIEYLKQWKQAQLQKQQQQQQIQ